MKKVFIMLLALAMVAGLMTACGSNSSPDPDNSGAASVPTADGATEAGTGEKFKIAICATSPDNTWMAKEISLLEEECTKETDRFEYTVNAGVDTADQQNIIETYLLGDYDLIIVMPQDSALIAEACNKVYESGIPLIIADRPVDGENFLSHIGGSDYDCGVIAAKYLGEAMGGSGSVAVLRNWVGTEGDLLRYNGFADTIQEKYPNIKIVREVDGENSIEKGYQVMSDILTAVNHIDAVYAQVDESGIGAEQAIQNANRDDIKYIVGIGGAKECFNMMKDEGTIYTAIATYLPTSGMLAVQKAREHLLGAELEKEILDESILITVDNVDEYYDLGF